MKTHQPDIVLTRREDGRWFCRCLSCSESSVPTMHKPAAQDWLRAHTKAALAGERRPA